MTTSTPTRQPEKWVVHYFHSERGRVERTLGDPGPSRTYQEQAEEFFETLRDDLKISNAWAERTYTASTRWIVRWLDQVRGWCEVAPADEEQANARVAELRSDRYVSNVTVRSEPVVKTERLSVLDRTGRPLTRGRKA